MEAINLPLLTIVGPTASGKTSLAIDIAQQIGGEIISADARTVYKGMDIGTAKPSNDEQQQVPHHLLDIVEPNQAFTAADFKRKAVVTIDGIKRRGKTPIMVGGSGLYVDAVLFDFSFQAPADPQLRQRLEKLPVLELQQLLLKEGIKLPKNSQNPRHLIRAYETKDSQPQHKPMRSDATVFGIEIDRAMLKQRIAQRVEDMVSQGLQQEVMRLAERWGWDAPGMSAIGYKEWQPMTTEKSADVAVIKQRIIKNTYAYAKRQQTWFRRNNSIHWLDYSSNNVDIRTTIMNKIA